MERDFQLYLFIVFVNGIFAAHSLFGNIMKLNYLFISLCDSHYLYYKILYRIIFRCIMHIVIINIHLIVYISNGGDDDQRNEDDDGFGHARFVKIEW